MSVFSFSQFSKNLMFQPKATVICDSRNQSGDRLTTFVLTYHRMIHSEFMTHRMLSKNSSSSRAIPVEKMIKLVESQEVYPLHWGKNQKGMVADNEASAEDIQAAKIVWDYARLDAIKHARTMVKRGIHKQVVNRLLEPFSSITVICSGTEYQNFFEQRCHPDSQPEIRALADAMQTEYKASEPKKLLTGMWHMPFIKDEELHIELECPDFDDLNHHFAYWVEVATGRCARVSYLNHEGIRDTQADIALHDRLLSAKPSHLSPFEHCAIALSSSEKCANYTGFRSYRFDQERKAR